MLSGCFAGPYSKFVGLGNLVVACLAGGCFCYGAGPTPEISAAFDRYVKVTEAGMQARHSPDDFLWLSQHRKEKTMVWMSQNFLIPRETPDHGEKIEIPGASLQHWLGAVYLETANLDRIGFMLLNYASYKNFFPPQVTESRLVKRDGFHFDASLRLRKRQITQVALDADITSQYQAVDPQRATIVTRATRIRDAEHSKKKDSDRDPASGQPSDYLWGLNLYWHLEEANPGVYAELELISLAPSTGTLHPGRYLNGFQTFPRELAQGFLDGLARAFPPPRK